MNVEKPNSSGFRPRHLTSLEIDPATGREFIASEHAGLADHGIANDPIVGKLIYELHRAENKVRIYATIVPGGEMIQFSAPMNKLIRMGGKPRPLLHRSIRDRQIQNEVFLILGAIGDPSTVPLLIDEYPTAGDVSNSLRRRSVYEKMVVCLTFALTYLTAQPIGRDRRGTDFDPGNKARWQEWWQENRQTFVTPAPKQAVTWLPDYQEAMTPSFLD